MNVAQICPRYFPYIGGVENHVQEISERLAKNIQVDVLTTDPEKKYKKNEVINNTNIYRFNAYAPSESYYFSFDLYRYLKKNQKKYDIFHAHSYHAFPSLFTAKFSEHVDFFFTPHYHGKGHTFFRNLLHKPYKLLGKTIFEKAKKIIAVSNYEKKIILNDFNINEQKIHVIPNGVNINEFKNTNKKSNKGMNLLSVGRLEKYKGMHHIINTMPLIDQEIKLEIIGKGPYESELVKLIEKKNLKDRVSMSRNLPRSQLIQKYIDADAFILLSTNEAYGISVAEALASRTPCILADTSALSEWIDNKTCFGVSDPSDYYSIKDVIEKNIGKEINPTSLYSWDKVVMDLTKLYAGEGL